MLSSTHYVPLYPITIAQCYRSRAAGVLTWTWKTCLALFPPSPLSSSHTHNCIVSPGSVKHLYSSVLVCDKSEGIWTVCQLSDAACFPFWFPQINI
ncbi:hypothetical protein VTK73DRAFT_10225 [Phialemonium thermophilum]|uniref:Uncharacterized protein n=1 Tax=Phialemonium thermophilum TaxID=223376 RepID=A0ABR3XI47_9PEZI